MTSPRPYASPMLSALQGHHGTDSNPFSRPHTPHKELTIGFCGLGAMGYPMARNIATRQVSATFQPPILVWNRTRAKAEALQREAGQSKRLIPGSFLSVQR